MVMKKNGVEERYGNVFLGHIEILEQLLDVVYFLIVDVVFSRVAETH
jgi:hypothetical protein